MSRTSSKIARSYAAPPHRLTAQRQRLVLATALFAGMVEIVGLLGGLPFLTVGRIVLSPSVLPGLALVWLLGRRSLGRSRSTEAATPFWIAIGIGLAFGGFMLAREHHRIDALSVLIASANEEIIYRFAIPTVLAAILISIKVRVAPARVAGFVIGAIWFVILPGHRAQMTDATQVLPFVAFATLAAYIVYRSGSFAATAAVHTVMNMLTILALGGVISPATRGAGIAIVLVLLVGGYALPPRRFATVLPADMDLTALHEEGSVIDLRDGVTPSHTSADGVTTPLVEPVDAEPR